MVRGIIQRLMIAAVMLTLGIVEVKADNWKTVEASEKRVPAWVNAGHTEGMLSITAEAPSLQEARRMAEQTLMRTIIQAVAANVTSSSMQNDSNEAIDGKVTTKEEYQSRLEITAAKLPFIKGVSLSEAKGQYWERRENKQSKQNLYILTVLYPMPESELERMRRQFEEYDRLKVNEYNALERSYSEVNTVEGITEAAAALEGLEEYFFDSVRRTQASTLRGRYLDLFRMVTLTGEAVGTASSGSASSGSPSSGSDSGTDSSGFASSGTNSGTGEFILRTELRGKPFVTGKVPEVTSDCATRIKVTPIEGGAAFRVTYSTEDCLPDEINSLKASLRLNSARLSTTLHF